jgi:hypothetical protein
VTAKDSLALLQGFLSGRQHLADAALAAIAFHAPSGTSLLISVAKHNQTA